MIIYGKNVIFEAIINDHKIYEIFIDNKFNEYKLLNLINEKGIKYSYMPKDKLNEMTNNALHQGIVANVKEYKTYSLDEILSLKNNDNNNDRLKLIILDSVQDPHNLGAVIRTAEATKMTAIIICDKNSVGITSSVVKVSAGAIERVKICVVKNLNNAIIKLKDNDVVVYSTDMKANLTYKELPKNMDVAVVLGNEGYGVRTLVKKNCTDTIKIPMVGKINSLNVSICAALIMYELI